MDHRWMHGTISLDGTALRWFCLRGFQASIFVEFDFDKLPSHFLVVTPQNLFSSVLSCHFTVLYASNFSKSFKVSIFLSNELNKLNMAVCMDDVLGSALSEQNDEVVVLESIYGDNFHLIRHDEDGEGNNKKRTEFNLSLMINHPHETVVVEAVVPVIIPEPLASSSDSDENENCDGENRENVENKAGQNGNVAIDESHAAADESGATGSNLTEPSGSQPKKKPGLSRLLSTKHWHIQSEVSSLTPIHLFCKFPPLYPTEVPPEFNIYCDWLSDCQIQELSKGLQELWQENVNTPVVFTWAEWLQNSSWEVLQLSSHLVLKEGFKESFSANDNSLNNSALELALLNIFEHDLHVKREEFFKVQHNCEICFEEKEGKQFCFLEECHHFCCLECLKLHCNTHIQSGSVTRLMCPTHDCSEVIPPHILQEILEEETYKRWERLLLSKTLDMMRDVYYCPRCNNVVVADEDESSRLAQCAVCFYSFCTECQGPWHGKESCNEEEEEKETENEKTRKLKKKKEKERKTKLKSQKISNSTFISAMKAKGMYRNCPRCKMVTEKISGCDFMTCSQCNANFCWICGKAITGYSHFSSYQCTKFGQEAGIPEVKPPSEGELLINDYKEKNPGQKIKLKKCPMCSQKNIKVLNNNHLKCWSCKKYYCYQCGKRIEDAFKHFASSSSCTQHSDD